MTLNYEPEQWLWLQISWFWMLYPWVFLWMLELFLINVTWFYVCFCFVLSMHWNLKHMGEPYWQKCQRMKDVYISITRQVCFLLVLKVYKVVNMDIFLTQMHIFASEYLYYPPRAVWTSFIMDGCNFLDFKFWATIDSQYKAWICLDIN